MHDAANRVPDLEPNCGSWVVVRRATGEAVLETYDRRVAEAINHDRYKVVTALSWLQSLNRTVRCA